MKPISIVFLYAVLALCSCTNDVPEASSGLSIATFNAQTLFDDVDDGDEFSPFRRHEGWSRSRYEARLARLRDLVKSDLEVDILFLQEVESTKVLEDLLDDTMRRRGYVYYAIADIDNPISVGFISKYKPISVTLHRIEEQRIVMRAEFQVSGRQLVVYVLHAKSNLGDADENRMLRKEYASLVNSMARGDRGAPVIVLGDFNSEPVTDASDMLTMAGVMSGPQIAGMSSIPVSSSREGLDQYMFYDAMLDPVHPAGADGTYFHEGTFYDYDRILMNDAALEAFPDANLRIVSAQAQNGIYPHRYDMEEDSGLSDHFPVKLTLM